MKAFIKENWFRVGILAILILGISLAINKQSPGQPLSFQEKIRKVSDATKVKDLYNSILPSLPPHNLFCIPSNKFHCDLDGCKEMEAGVFVLLGINQKEDSLFLARCDNKPCDMYDVDMIESGAFTTFETKEPHGMLFRTSSLNKSYVEIVTLGTESFISNGYCYSK